MVNKYYFLSNKQNLSSLLIFTVATQPKNLKMSGNFVKIEKNLQKTGNFEFKIEIVENFRFLIAFILIRINFQSNIILR